MRRVLLVPDLPSERWPSMDRYASRLAEHLSRQATDLEFELASPIWGVTSAVEVPGSVPSHAPRLPAAGTPEFRRYLARYVTYPRRVRAARADLVHVLDHSYAHVVHSVKRRPRVVTVHDLLPAMIVERGARGVRERIRNRLLDWVLAGLRRADAWIVATQWLRTELARLLGNDERIHVISFGVEDDFFARPAESREEIRRRLGVPVGAYVILHVGGVGPRKNMPAVIAAVHGVRSAGADAWLVQVGGKFTREHLADIDARGLSAFVRALGDSSEVELRAAYHAADVLLFPSHYEGFGLPVLEAMASGLPVVTSSAAGLAEAAGSAAVIVDGPDIDPYVAALRRQITHPAWRAQLIARGVEHARRFRWVETARRTAELYRSLL